MQGLNSQLWDQDLSRDQDAQQTKPPVPLKFNILKHNFKIIFLLQWLFFLKWILGGFQKKVIRSEAISIGCETGMGMPGCFSSMTSLVIERKLHINKFHILGFSVAHRVRSGMIRNLWRIEQESFLKISPPVPALVNLKWFPGFESSNRM